MSFFYYSPFVPCCSMMTFLPACVDYPLHIPASVLVDVNTCGRPQSLATLKIFCSSYVGIDYNYQDVFFLQFAVCQWNYCSCTCILLHVMLMVRLQISKTSCQLVTYYVLLWARGSGFIHHFFLLWYEAVFLIVYADS